MIILKILLQILLLPLKIVCFIVAYAFYLIMYIVSCFLTILNFFVGYIGAFLTVIWALGGIIMPIYTYYDYVSLGGTMTKSGIFLTIGYWVLAIITMQFSVIIEFISDGAMTIGEAVTDFAKWFAFEV